MTLYPGADASRPGARLPAGTRIVAGYVGLPHAPGAPDTPHIWTADEWNLYLDPASPLYGGDGIRCLPIYTHDYQGIAWQDARNAHEAAVALGWDPDRGSRIMAWDAEFLADDKYAAALRATLNKLGWLLMAYEQTPLQDPSVDLRWLFRIQPPHTRPPGELPVGADGLQWSFGPEWDLDLFSARVYDGCGRGVRKVQP